MNIDNLNEEISELTIKLNKALIELEEDGSRFIDKSKIDKVFTLNKKLEIKIKFKNLL